MTHTELVPRSHLLTSFIKARENKTTTNWLASQEQVCRQHKNLLTFLSINSRTISSSRAVIMMLLAPDLPRLTKTT